MSVSNTHPALADSAHVLSEQLQDHLTRLARFLKPHAARLERQFRQRLRGFRLDARTMKAMCAITPGGICSLLGSGAGTPRAFEEIEYQGRRLAKLNLRPQQIVEALHEYDAVLTPLLRQSVPGESENYGWVRDQLHFCTVLILNQAYHHVRETEARTFYELARRELEARGLDQSLQGALETLAAYAGAAAGKFYLAGGDSSIWTLRAVVPEGSGNGKDVPAPVGKLLRGPEYIRLDQSSTGVLDDEWRQSFRGVWSVPLRDGKRVVGVIQLAFPIDYEWLPREQELLESAAERCRMASEKARLLEDLAARQKQVRQLAERMLQVEEGERRRISRELHDEAGQSLLYVRLQLELLEATLPASLSEERKRLREVRNVTEHTIVEIRRLISALSPAVLEQLGLPAALRQLMNRLKAVHPCRVKLHLGRLVHLPKELETIAYRLVQECCNNIAKHSEARNVNISVHLVDGLLRVQVDDDGVGFEIEKSQDRPQAFGLAGIRERVAVLGGTCAVQSRQRRESDGGRSGTVLQIELPLKKSRGAVNGSTPLAASSQTD